MRGRLRRMGGVSLIGAIGGIFLSVGYVNPYSGVISLSELILQLSGSRGNFALGFSMPELLSLAIRLLPDLALEMYLGTEIYRHFCTASIYVFSRYPGRIAWYCREVAGLSAQVVVSQAVLLAAVTGVSAARYEVFLDNEGILFLAEHFALKSLWILGMILCVNLLGIGFGSGVAFLEVMGAQTVCVTLFGIAGTVGRNVSKGLGAVMLKADPMSYMVLGWQDREHALLPELFGPVEPEAGWFGSTVARFGKKEALLLYLILCAGIIFAGAVYVNHCELLCSNAEEGEI